MVSVFYSHVKHTLIDWYNNTFCCFKPFVWRTNIIWPYRVSPISLFWKPLSDWVQSSKSRPVNKNQKEYVLLCICYYYPPPLASRRYGLYSDAHFHTTICMTVCMYVYMYMCVTTLQRYDGICAVQAHLLLLYWWWLCFKFVMLHTNIYMCTVFWWQYLYKPDACDFCMF